MPRLKNPSTRAPEALSLPQPLQDVALINAKVAAAAGGMSVSWWNAEVAAGRAPQPVVRQTRCTRWSMASVQQFWQLFAERGASPEASALTLERAKHASQQASAKRRATHEQGAAP